MSSLWIAVITALWVVVAALVLLVIGLIRRVDELRVAHYAGRASGAPPGGGPTRGRRAPAVEGYEHLGVGGRERMVLFLSSTCNACSRLSAEIRTWQSHPADDQRLGGTELVVVGDEEMVAALAGAVPVVSQAGGLIRGWGIPGTPYIVGLDAYGFVQVSQFVTEPAELFDFSRLLGALATPERKIPEPSGCGRR